ncbi:ribonuclease H-like domain-containing protein [Paraphysoderma sedebokerense]|nr:ribonuclease H-like domain-containing protein [Paraphysoderma sedebokerense]
MMLYQQSAHGGSVRLITGTAHVTGHSSFSVHQSGYVIYSNDKYSSETDVGAMSHPHYSHLIIVDFEATCDEASPPRVTKDSAEIIEFSWIVLSTSSLEIVHQQQDYVKPHNTPVTEFCTRLTGITSEMLESGKTLKDAISTLENFISSLSSQGNTFCFITHGTWDLKLQLVREAKDKDIQMPEYLLYPKFFDVKQEVAKYGAAHPNSPISSLSSFSVKNLCKVFNVELAEPEHSGLNDCISIGNIVKFMLSNPARDTFKYPVDTMADLLQFQKEQSKVVHLNGLPFDVTQAELEAWFVGNGLHPASLLCLLNQQRKPSGAGFAVLATHDEASTALNMNGRQLVNRTVEVNPSSETVVDAAASFLVPFPSIKQQRNDILRAGDWICEQCKYHNFASRRSCNKCLSLNPNPPPTTPNATTNFAKGDWICGTVNCQFHNYASRNLCLRCGNPKPGGGGGSNFRPGDWLCPNAQCQFQNFASRTMCLRCGTTNQSVTIQSVYTSGHHPMSHPTMYPPTPYNPFMQAPMQNQPLPAAPFRSGDWYCSCCATHNFASRHICIRCQVAQPNTPNIAPSGLTGMAGQPKKMLAGDWICSTPSCGYHNFARRRNCAKCGAIGSGNIGITSS